MTRLHHPLQMWPPEFILPPKFWFPIAPMHLQPQPSATPHPRAALPPTELLHPAASCKPLPVSTGLQVVPATSHLLSQTCPGRVLQLVTHSLASPLTNQQTDQPPRGQLAPRSAPSTVPGQPRSLPATQSFSLCTCATSRWCPLSLPALSTPTFHHLGKATSSLRWNQLTYAPLSPGNCHPRNSSRPAPAGGSISSPGLCHLQTSSCRRL